MASGDGGFTAADLNDKDPINGGARVYYTAQNLFGLSGQYSTAPSSSTRKFLEWSGVAIEPMQPLYKLNPYSDGMIVTCLSGTNSGCYLFSILHDIPPTKFSSEYYDRFVIGGVVDGNKLAKIFLGASRSKFVKTINFTTVPMPMDASPNPVPWLNSGSIEGMEVNPANAYEVVVVVRRPDAIWYSSDMGSSWTNVYGNIESTGRYMQGSFPWGSQIIPLRPRAYSFSSANVPDSVSAIVVGTFMGPRVMFSSNPSQWYSFYNGELPTAVVVSDIVYDERTDRMHMSTLGRGIYRLENATLKLACKFHSAAGLIADTVCQTSLIVDRSPCKKGTAGTPGACTPCAMGTYAVTEGLSACLSCSSPQSTLATGSTTCQNCSKGAFYSSLTKLCSSASAGFYVGIEGATAQTACPAGKFSNSVASWNCTNCPVGFFSTATASKACTACSLDKTSSAGATSCVAKTCIGGQYLAVGSQAAACTPCTLGTSPSSYDVNNSALTSIEACPLKCPSGKYGALVQAGGATIAACQNCPAGKYAGVDGKTACDSCVPGSFQNSTAQTQCLQCSPGKFQSSSTQVDCNSCPDGTSSASGAVSCFSAFWSASDWSPCSVSDTCGLGTTNRSVSCASVGQAGLVHVADSACALSGPKPAVLQTCGVECLPGPVGFDAKILGGGCALLSWGPNSAWATSWVSRPPYSSYGIQFKYMFGIQSGANKMSLNETTSLSFKFCLRDFPMLPNNVTDVQFLVMGYYFTSYPVLLRVPTDVTVGANVLLKNAAVLAAPTNLIQGASPSPTTLYVTSDVVAGAAYYVSQFSTDNVIWSFGPRAVPSSSAATNVSFQIDGLVSGRNYFIRVASVNIDGYSEGYSNVVQLQTTNPTPPTPKNAKLVVANNFYQLVFDVASPSPIYVVEGYYYVTPTSTAATPTKTDIPAFEMAPNVAEATTGVRVGPLLNGSSSIPNLNGLNPGHTYFYRVASKDTTANKNAVAQSAFSSYATVSNPCLPPGAATGISVISGGTTASVTWVAPALQLGSDPAACNSPSYLVKTFLSGSVDAISTLQVKGTNSLFLSGLTPDTKYSVEIQTFSDQKGGITYGIFWTRPAALTIVSIVAAGQSPSTTALLAGATITVTFSANTNMPSASNVIQWANAYDRKTPSSTVLPAGLISSLGFNSHWTNAKTLTYSLASTISTFENIPTVGCLTALVNETSNLVAVSAVTGNFSVPLSGPVPLSSSPFRLLNGNFVLLTGSFVSFQAAGTITVSLSEAITTTEVTATTVNPFLTIMVFSINTAKLTSTTTYTLSLSVSVGTIGFTKTSMASSITLKGTPAFLKTEFADIFFTAPTFFFGDASLTVTLLSSDAVVSLDTKTLAIKVSHVAQEPAIVQSVDTVSEGVSTGLFLLKDALTVGSTASSETFRVLVSVSAGSLSAADVCINRVKSLAPTVMAAITPLRLDIQGSLVDVNMALTCLNYTTTAADSSGAVRVITVTAINLALPNSVINKVMSLKFSCSSGAITASQAIFTDSFSGITINFNTNALDNTVTSAGTSTTPACQRWFSTQTVASFGSSPACLFDGKSSVFVKLGSEPSIVPTRTVSFLANSFVRCPGATNNAFSVTVASAVNPVAPLVTLTAPAKIGSCSDFVAYALVSGIAGRPGTIVWAGDSNAPMQYAVTSAGGSILTIAAGFLASVSSFKVTVFVKSFYNISSSVAEADVLRDNALKLPVLRVKGPSNLKGSTTSDLSLAAQADFPTCLQSASASLGFSWDVSPALPSGLDASTASTLKLRVPAGTLSVGTYTFTVSAFLKSAPQNKVTDTVTVTVAASPLKGVITGGSAVSASTSRAITVDASSSQDPDDVATPPSASWICAASDTTPCINMNTGSNLVLSNDLVLTILEGTLQPDTYTFTLTLTKDSRSATASQKVTVVTGNPPAVQLSSNPTKVLPTSSLAITSTVTAYNPGAVTYLWSVSPNSIDLTDTKICKSFTSTSLVLKSEGAALFAEGVNYVFKLVVTDAAKQQSTSEVSVTAVASPSNGKLQVSPSEGLAYNTSFTVRSVEWFDANLPLTCTFFSVGSRGQRTPLGDSTTDCSLTGVSLAPGTGAGNTMVLGVSVSNSLGATSVAMGTVVVKPPATALSTAAAEDLVSEAIATAAAKGNTDLVFNTVNNVIAGASTSSSDIANAGKLRETGMAAISSLATSATDIMVTSSLVTLAGIPLGASSTAGVTSSLISTAATVAMQVANTPISDVATRIESLGSAIDALTYSQALTSATIATSSRLLSWHRHLMAVSNAAKTFSNITALMEATMDTALTTSVDGNYDYEYYGNFGLGSVSIWQVTSIPAQDLSTDGCTADNLQQTVRDATSVKFALCGFSNADAVGKNAVGVHQMVFDNSVVAYTLAGSSTEILRGYVTWVKITDASAADLAVSSSSLKSATAWSVTHTIQSCSSYTVARCKVLSQTDFATWSTTGVSTAYSCASNVLSVTCSYTGLSGAYIGVLTSEGTAPATTTLTKVLLLSLKLTASFSEMLKSPGAETFKTEVKADIATALSIAASRITINSVVEGSIIVSSTIVDSAASGSGRSIDNLAAALTGISTTAINSMFIFPNSKWTNNINASAFKAGIAYECCDGTFKTPASACPSTCAGTKGSSSSFSQLVIIVIAAAGAILVAVLVYCACCRKNSASAVSKSDVLPLSDIQKEQQKEHQFQSKSAKIEMTQRRGGWN
jgi:hypothetical protein